MGRWACCGDGTLKSPQQQRLRVPNNNGADSVSQAQGVETIRSTGCAYESPFD